jgi:hypothetical protein
MCRSCRDPIAAGGRSKPGCGSVVVLVVALLAAAGCRGRPTAATAGAGSSRPEIAGGYVLFAPLLSTATYLIDRQGRVVHTWETSSPPGCTVYLLDNGHLLRAERHPDRSIFGGGGEGGRIVELDWDGKVVWDFVLASATMRQHHDIEPLPNGNVLMIVWERKSRAEALAAGRRLELVGEPGLLPDCLLEVKPAPPRGGEVVWEWHLWDHLVQDLDPARANFGEVSAHPELIDANGGRGAGSVTDEVLQRLRSLGYLAHGASAGDADADFVHTNSVAYDPRRDQIALSVNAFNEIWIIDHGTTSAQAAGHVGGRAGRGGDLLYRWGNPRAYGRGSEADQRLFGQHDARWIADSFPGAGHLTVFNNGDGRPGATTPRCSSSTCRSLPTVGTPSAAMAAGGRSARSGSSRRPTGGHSRPTSCPARSVSPTATPSSATARAGASSRSPPMAPPSGSTRTPTPATRPIRTAIRASPSSGRPGSRPTTPVSPAIDSRPSILSPRAVARPPQQQANDG